MSSPNTRNPYVQWYQQNKTLVWGAAAAAVSLYATYKVTSSAALSNGDNDGKDGRARHQHSHFQRLRNMVKNYSAAASTLAETAALVSGDLQAFLASDSSELPQSIRQLNKLLQAPELQETISTVTASVVRGVSKATGGPWNPDAPPLLDTIIEAVLSERGRGLIGMAVGIAMRNSTTAVCEFIERRMEAASSSGQDASLGMKEILDLLSSEQGERILTMFLTQSIRTAVTSYVDATAGYNLYNDMLASLVKQEHRDALTDLLSRISASFCREAVLSYRRAATGGMAAGNVNSGSGTTPSSYAANHAFSSKHTSVNAAATISTSGLTCLQGSGAASSLSGPANTAATVGAVVESGVESGRAATLPVVKSNGQPPGTQNARPSQSSQLHKQHSLGGGNGLLGGTSSNVLAVALGRGMGPQTAPVWLRQVVDLMKEREIRSLAVDVVKSASREATRGAVEGLLQVAGMSPESVAASVPSGVLVLPPSITGYKLFVLATVAVSLCTYALSPRIMVL